MNARLRDALVNPWLAASASFAPIVFAFAFATLFLLPHSNGESLGGMAWCAPPGGLAGAGAVSAGLRLIGTVGAGALDSRLISADPFASIAIDRLGRAHAGTGRLAGGALNTGGIGLVALV